MVDRKNDSKLQNRYFKEISNYPLLSRKEEIDLARRAREGDEEARKKLDAMAPERRALYEGEPEPLPEGHVLTEEEDFTHKLP